jgi:hypothetical protein
MSICKRDGFNKRTIDVYEIHPITKDSHLQITAYRTEIEIISGGKYVFINKEDLPSLLQVLNEIGAKSS